LPRPTLNLGILAHVDAGKTTLTERLLYAAGVIDEIGSVDAGTTQTDSLALERQRGITIKSAVVSFAIGGVTVNLIDTPGHPDFIAEVERCQRTGLRTHLQGRARPRRREARLRPHVLRHGPHPRSPAVQRWPRGQGHRDRRIRARHDHHPRVRLGRPDRQAAGPGRDPDRRSDRGTRPQGDQAAVRPADAGIGGSGPA
jgi:Elongation factor Tu GTP binding domain